MAYCEVNLIPLLSRKYENLEVFQEEIRPLNLRARQRQLNPWWFSEEVRELV